MSTTQLTKPSEPIRDRLSGRVILITGGAGAIGLATATRLLLEGARVAIVDRNAAALEVAVERLGALKSLETTSSNEKHVMTIQADVSIEGDVQRYVQEIMTQWGHIDGAFLNAGICNFSTPLVETSLDMWETTLRTNVTSAFLGIKHLAPVLSSGASIVLTSSTAGLRGTPGMSAYSTSKYALRGLSLTAAQELGPRGIRVNTVHPGAVETPMFEAAWSDETRDFMRKATPLGRLAGTEDIAATVAFLMSGESVFLSAGMFKVDGGVVAW